MKVLIGMSPTISITFSCVAASRSSPRTAAMPIAIVAPADAPAMPAKGPKDVRIQSTGHALGSGPVEALAETGNMAAMTAPDGGG